MEVWSRKYNELQAKAFAGDEDALHVLSLLTGACDMDRIQALYARRHELVQAPSSGPAPPHAAAHPLAQYRVVQGFDIFIVPRFAQDILLVDPRQLQAGLEADYPMVSRGGVITPCAPQWVDGSNAALNYRGNDLKRFKMWFQKGDPRQCGFVKYYYTGFTHPIRPKDCTPCASVRGGVP
jgi:hypothetical protein